MLLNLIDHFIVYKKLWEFHIIFFTVYINEKLFNHYLKAYIPHVIATAALSTKARKGWETFYV